MAWHGMAWQHPRLRPTTLAGLLSYLQEYVRVFEPLLLEECAAQMLRGQEEGQVLTSQVRWCAHHHVAQTRCIHPTFAPRPGSSR